MSDFLTALGLLFVIEGVLYGLMPGLARRLARSLEKAPEGQLRIYGLVAIAVGVGIIWLLRG